MLSETPPSRARRWEAIFLISLVYPLASIQISVATILFPMLKQEFDLSHQQLGTFATIYLLSRAAFGPLWGMLADRFGHKRMLIASLAINGVLVFSTGFVASFDQLLILYSLSILCTVAAEPITYTIASTVFPSSDRGKAFGSMRAVRGLLGGGFILAVGWFGSFEEGWRYALMAFGTVKIAITLALGKRLRSRVESSNRDCNEPKFEWNAFKSVTKKPVFILFTLIHILATGMLMPVFMPTFLVELRGQTLASASALVGAMKICMFFGALLGGVLGDLLERVSPSKGRIVLLQAYAAIFASLNVILFLPDWQHTSVLWTLSLLVSTVFPVGFTGCVLPMLANVVPFHLRSASFAIMASLCQGLSLAGISTAIGSLSEHRGLDNALFLAFSIPYAIIAMVCIALYRYYPSELAARTESANGPAVSPHI
ncbi:MFS transporter [Pelagicoccus sp. SDUM812003]|uniref:MFS transporter n=1 Tax=Pelagicoccus sp. SDUM812003 TaxID=3041267 RepID=UPI00281050F8|nr:MFS transporter [Pelagicoccus sp. SDUM812003]MDQ8205017.1 MFS transporter [Pelagicoccus sp. SDUM812003]